MADYQWQPIASVFPAGLDSETDRTKLRDGWTPDAYGMDIDNPGRLVNKNAELTAGSAMITPTKTISAVVWTWYYRRCWLISSANLKYNAPEYDAAVLPQGLSIVSFDEDAQSLVQFFPVGRGDMFVAKSTGGYIIPGASSFAGDYQHGHIEPAMKVATSGNAIELDGVPYASNAFGLMRWDGGRVDELTAPVRDDVSTTFANRALTRDVQKRRIIAAGYFVYDVPTKKLFKYTLSSTAFRFTTRTLVSGDGAAFRVSKVAFEYFNNTDKAGEITLQARRDADWELVETREIEHGVGQRRWISHPLRDSLEAREFTLRLTALSAHIHIRRIHVHVSSGFVQESPSQ